MVKVLKTRTSLLASRELPANGNRLTRDHAAGDRQESGDILVLRRFSLVSVPVYPAGEPQHCLGFSEGVINRRGAIGM